MSDLTRQVTRDHVLRETRKTKGDFITNEASCSCGHPLPWTGRIGHHQDHVLEEVENAARTAALPTAVLPTTALPTVDALVDLLVMSPLADTAGTDLAPFRRTAEQIHAATTLLREPGKPAADQGGVDPGAVDGDAVDGDRATLIATVARALWDHDMSDQDPDWRQMAWDDMGGAEPAEERIGYELRAHAVVALADPKEDES
ncbi:hypothetical protein GCG21_08780 [Pseudactinotalea sp. HY160]|uniref:hypothetical protein n=1 Tax=Pseudactinotalea sp. HY160 TaxID=2654490 RepID=UPI00128B614A|nr:hypothetical protein [Pseudactinotalea sp. HY160]MPV50099.1 hypothetical protein [Pseudactinotalea sp. HY160]